MQIEYLADRPELIPELAQWHLAEWGRLHPGQTLQTRIAALRASLGKKGQIPLTLVAVDGAELVGSALLVEHDMSTRQELSPWLAGVFVKPQCRRSGVASALIQGVEEQALAAGVPRLYLYTDQQADFYAKRGWQEREVCDYRGLSVTIMSKLMPVTL